MTMKVEVRGAAAKIDALYRFDKEVWKGVQAGVKTATGKVTAHAKSRVPFMGLVPKRAGTGWGKWTEKKTGRDFSFDSADFRFTTKFRSKQQEGFRQIEGRSSLTKKKPSTAIFLLAGSVDKSGHPFNRNINKQTGTKKGAPQTFPRLLTPAYYAEGPEAAKEIARIVQSAVSKV